MEIRTEGISFLVYSYFGITPEEFQQNKKDIIMAKCIERAYLDLSRTIEFRQSVSELEKVKKSAPRDYWNAVQKKQQFIGGIVKTITEEMVHLDPENKEDFSTWHQKVCDGIIGTYDNNGPLAQGLSVGQAQKWLNMSLKYMWLLGLLDDKTDYLHVPVDSFIMEAASKKLQIELPSITGTNNFYNETSSKRWSNWNGYESEYLPFQNNLQEKVADISPIKWENAAWIEVAETRKHNAEEYIHRMISEYVTD